MHEGNSDLMTIAEVANELRVDQTTVRRWITQGTLNAIKLPSSDKRQLYRVSRATLNGILNGK